MIAPEIAVKAVKQIDMMYFSADLTINYSGLNTPYNTLWRNIKEFITKMQAFFDYKYFINKDSEKFLYISSYSCEFIN